MTEIVPVTQDDRKAAAVELYHTGDPQVLRCNILLGNLDDHDLVQAFARHRIASEKAERERIVAWLRDEAALRLRLSSETKGLDASHYNHTRYIAVDVAADSIAAGDHLPTTSGDKT